MTFDLPVTDARTPSPQRLVDMYLETNVPGAFAVGDVRHGSTKRVASAVGAGAIAVHLVHEYLAGQARRLAWAAGYHH